jgi:hypothetical protein
MAAATTAPEGIAARASIRKPATSQAACGARRVVLPATGDHAAPSARGVATGGMTTATAQRTRLDAVRAKTPPR